MSDLNDIKNNISNLKISSNEKKFLLIDGFNQVGGFMNSDNNKYMKQPFDKRITSDHSNLNKIEHNVKKFINEWKNRNYNILFFLDAYRKNEIDKKKWMRRRIESIVNEFRGVPYGHGIILANFFEKYGAEIHYCHTEIADDVIAAYASEFENSIIISADRGFYKYKYKNVPKIIYKTFIKNNQVIELYGNINFVPELEVIHPLPETKRDEAKISMLIRDKEWIMGVPTSLCKKFGNINIVIQKLRQSVYYEIFDDKNTIVNEYCADWNNEKNLATLDHYEIKPDNKYLSLLKYNPRKAINIFFPKEHLYSVRKYLKELYKNNKSLYRKNGIVLKLSIDEMLFSNYLFSVYCTVLALHCFVNNNAYLVQKLFKYYYINKKCSICKRKMYFDMFDIHWYENQGWKLPNKCYKCKMNMKNNKNDKNSKKNKTLVV